MRQLAAQGGHAHRVTRAIELPHKNFDQPLRIERIVHLFTGAERDRLRSFDIKNNTNQMRLASTNTTTG